MKYRYTIEVIMYDGRTVIRTIEADEVHFQEGSIKFVSDGGSRWILISVYPSDKTIIKSIENLK